LVEQLPGTRVPDFDDAITTTRGQEASILAERHAARIMGVAQRWVHDLLARFHVPDPDGAIRTGRGQTRDIWMGTERHIKDGPVVAAESTHFLSGRRVSDLDGKIAARGPVLAIRAEGHGATALG